MKRLHEYLNLFAMITFLWYKCDEMYQKFKQNEENITNEKIYSYKHNLSKSIMIINLKKKLDIIKTNY